MFWLKGVLCFAALASTFGVSYSLDFTTTCSRDAVYVRWNLDSANFPHRIRFRRDLTCRARAKPNRVAEFKIDLLNVRLCGGQMKRNGKYVSYRNEIVHLDIRTGVPLSLYNVTCLFEGQETVPTLFSERSMFIDSFGSLELNIYRSSTFSPANSLRDLILFTSVGQFLYVEIKASLIGASNSDPSNRPFEVERCAATFQHDVINQNVLHGLIEKGCPSRRDPTVSVLEAAEETPAFRYRFQMFNWLNATEQRIYLFCDVILCEANSESCKLSYQCPKRSARGRRSAESQPTQVTSERLHRSVRLGFGPIFPVKQSLRGGGLDFGNSSNVEDSLKFARNDENSDYTAVYASVGVVCGIVFVMLLVALVVLAKRSRSGRYHTQAHKRPNVQSGFAFAIRSSKDAPPADVNKQNSVVEDDVSA